MNKKIIFSILGVILLVGVLFAVSYFVPAIRETVYGSSLMSLQQVELQSSSSYFSGKSWVYTFRAGGLGQNAYGYVSTAVADQMNTGVERPKENLRIDTAYDQSCNYKIRQSSKTPVYEFSLKSWTDYVGGCDSADITAKCPNSIGYWKPSLSTTCYCIDKKQIINNIGYIDNPEVRTKIDITVTVKGIIDKLSMDTSKSIQGAVGSNVYAVWQGNLDTGQSCSSPFEVLPIYTSNGWVLSDQNRYTDYINNYNSFNLAVATWANTKPSPEKVTALLTEINSKAYGVRDARTSFGEINQKTDQNNAYINRPVLSFIQYPVLTLYVKADYLGIYTPVPKPEIVSASSNCFVTSQSTGKIDVVVKNAGDERGDINVYAECDSGFFATRQQVSVSAGEQKSVSLPLSGTGAKAKNEGKCLVYAESVGTRVSREVGVCATVPKICTPNQQRCQMNDIKQCDAEGLNENVVQTCANGCDDSSGSAICNEEKTEGCKTDAECQNLMDDKNECTIEYCDKSLVSSVSSAYNTCARRFATEEEKPSCHEGGLCKPYLSIGFLTILPNLSEGCMDFFAKVKTVVFLIALLALPFIIAMLLKSFGFGGEGKKNKGKNIFRIVFSILVGWLLAVLIWTLFWVAVGISVGILLIFVVSRKVLKAVKGGMYQ